MKRWAVLAVAFVMVFAGGVNTWAEESDERFPLKGYLTDFHVVTEYEYPSMNPVQVTLLNKDGDNWMLNDVSGGALMELAGVAEYQPEEGEAHPVTEEIRRFLNSFDWKNASEYEKAYQAAKFMVDSGITYDGDITSVNNDIYTCLVLKKSACKGLSDTYHTLAKSVGLNCVNLATTQHEWNNVMVDGEWKKIDMSVVVQGVSSIERYLNQSSPDEWTFDSKIPLKIGAIK